MNKFNDTQIIIMAGARRQPLLAYVTPPRLP